MLPFAQARCRCRVRFLRDLRGFVQARHFSDNLRYLPRPLRAFRLQNGAQS
jgi:hypothetical protein